jgi:hypothetical protein
MSKQLKNIFSDTACPSQQTMFRYVDNLLKGEEKHAFERHLAGCSLCADAFDGLSIMSKAEAEEDVAALHSLIDKQYVKRERAGYWAWAVAASVSMLLIAGSWAYLHRDREASVAVETKTVMPKTEPVAEPSAAVTPESVMDSIAAEPADKTIALSNDVIEEKNISSDAGNIHQPKSEQEVLLRYDKPQVEPTAPQSSHTEKARTAAPPARADYSSMAMDQETVDQKKSSKDDDLISKPSSAGIASQMLAFEESIINKTSEVQKENVSTSSVATNKAAKSLSAAPSAAPSPQPSMKAEERKKAKSMSGCQDCPDKTISQGASQDMQELAYDYAVRKFREKSYAEAHMKFAQLINENPDSYQAASSRLYDAICLIYQNQPDEALVRLNELNSNKEFADDANWLKAAIYVDQNKPEDAKSLLKSLEKNKAYKEKASTALESLR